MRLTGCLNKDLILHTAIIKVRLCSIAQQSSNGATDATRPRIDAPLVRKLVESGAPLNAKDKEGYTALDYAKKYKLTEIIAYLIAQGKRVS